MNKILIIIRREFLKRIQKKSFIILTLLMPFFMALLIVAPLLLSSIKSGDQKDVAIVDPTLRYAEALKHTSDWHFVYSSVLLPEMRGDDSRYEAVIVIPDSLVEKNAPLTIYSKKEVNVSLLSYVQTVITDVVRKEKLKLSGVPQLETIMADIQREVPVKTMKWDEHGNETTSSTDVAIGAGMVFTFLIYMFVMIYGAMVMQGVIEEKKNRIVELMVSSVRPFQLMMGKIIGIALVGLLQLAIWATIVALLVVFVIPLLGIDTSETQQQLLAAFRSLPYVEMSVMFLLMFIGGYLLYASFLAAMGAAVNESEDSTQFMIPVTFVMIFGLYAAMYGCTNTDGPLAFWTSIIPLTSPIVMMVRIPFGVPLWQELLSLVLLYGTAIGMVWVSGRIYRVGILMYGKKPSLKEMLKWLRYK